MVDLKELAKECGFTGTMEEFKAQAAKVQNESMNLDAMDVVAGGGFLDYWRELAEYMWNPAEYRKKHQEPEEKINLRDVLNDA